MQLIHFDYVNGFLYSIKEIIWQTEAIYRCPLTDQGTFTPVGAQGGVPWNPLRKPISHRNFAMKFAPYMYGRGL